MATSAHPTPSQTPETEEDKKARRRSRYILTLGIGLFFYALGVIYVFAKIFPKSPPSASLVLRVSDFADKAERNALRADSNATSARRGNDTAFARQMDSAARVSRLTAARARISADSVEREALDPQDARESITFLKWTVAEHLSFEWRLILVALLAGMIGAFIHAAVSFSTFVGNRAFAESWTWWYTLRPLVGGALALVTYLVFRGALVAGTAVDTLNAYGVAGLAALTGMFSKQAIDKLDEVFSVLFRRGGEGGDAQRHDKVTASTPTFTAVDPARPKLDAGKVAFIARGSGFSASSVVYIEDVPATTTFVDGNTLQAMIGLAKLPGSGPFNVTVRTPPASGAPAGTKGTVAGPLSVDMDL